MPEARKTVVDVLFAAQRLGTLGDRPIADVIEHACQFLPALAGVTGKVIDIGTGAGVPGLVVAERRPDLEMVLVDRRATRMDSLALGVAGLGWSERVTVLTADVDDLGRDAGHAGTYSAVVSRGFGPPEVTARLARPLLAIGGLLVVSEPPEPDPSRWSDDVLEASRFGHLRHLPGVVVLTAV